MRDYRKLEVWRRSHGLVLRIYEAAGELPASERFGLARQMTRAAASIPTNIAEAAGRRSPRDRNRFIRFSIGSLTELEYQLLLARDLGMIGESHRRELTQELGEIRGMLLGLERAWSSFASD